MAFQFTNEGVPYHPLVAPVVPEPDNTAAKIISEGTGPAINAFVHMALGAQQAKLEQAQMLQRADLAAQELQYKDKWQTQEYDLKKKEGDIQDKLRMDSYKALNDMRTSSADLNREKLNQLKDGAISNAQAQLQFGQTMRSVNKDFMGRAQELGVFDAKLQTQDPVAFADAVSTLKNEYQNAPAPSGIPGKLTQLQRIADQQKATIKLNDKPTKLSYQQILNGLRNPDTHDEYYKGLMDSGHIKSVQDTGKVKPASWQHPLDSIYDYWTGTTEKKTIIKPAPLQGKLIDQSGMYNPAESSPRIPSDLPRNVLDMKASIMMGKSTPVPEPTDTDKMIGRAKAAVSAGKDPDAVRQLLIQNNIDPSQAGL